MADDIIETRGWLGVHPWMILGILGILLTIFSVLCLYFMHSHKESGIRLLLEKGSALLKSFEAGARADMMGSMGTWGTDLRLQKLMSEMAQQPDIFYIIVADINGNIVAHSNPAKIGGSYGKQLSLEQISRSKKVEWRQVLNPEEPAVFEVFRHFAPTHKDYGNSRSGIPYSVGSDPEEERSKPDQIIFLGLDMRAVKAARKGDIQHAVIMTVILLLIGCAGIVSLFLAQTYHSARTSLTTIKAFSDNVVENMPIGLIAIDADGKIASFNQTAETALQLPSHEIVGRKSKEVLPKQLSILPDEIDTAEGIFVKEIDCPLRNGKLIPLDVSASLLEGNNSTFLGYLILFRDLTEVQRLKKEIERSRRLASIGRLAAGIAHEIRNPLSSIKGFATHFRERYRDVPEDEKTAEIMIQEVERLNRVIGELLEFARPMEVHKKPTSIQEVIQHSLRTIERQVEAKNIKIDKSFFSEIGDVYIDPDRISQVFLNLYLNAIEAMEDGGTLSVVLYRDEDSQRVKITISDTGTGIKKEDLVHIFDPYFTTRQSGTGLGLAIVHKIIESHRGEVRVESEPSKGTTVSVLLPFA
jgi:two-component system sensor histidine kinase HydH